MNTDTGHLVNTAEMTEDEFEKLREEGYEPVPNHLIKQAELELMGLQETYVGKNASGSLSKHMRYKRKKKRQMAKALRRKNRCHSN